MGEDSVDIGNIEREVANLYREVFRALDKTYRTSQPGRINPNYLPEGQKALNQIKSLSGAEDVIQRNIESLVQSINPSTLVQTLVASGVSYEAASNAARIIAQGHRTMKVWEASRVAVTAATTAVEAGSASSAATAIARACGVGVVILVAIIALYLIWQYSQKEDSPAKRQVSNHYKNQIESHHQANSFGHGARRYNMPRNL